MVLCYTKYMLSVLQNLDYQAVKHALDFSNSGPIPALIVYYCAEILIYLFALAVIYLWRKPEPVSKHHGNKKAVIMVIMTLAVSLAVKSLIAFVINRHRPFVAHPDLLLPFPTKVDSSSFPSGHTLIAFSIAFSLLFSGSKKWGWTLLAGAVLIGLGRIFAGVHYPTDVVASVAIAFVVAWYVHREASSLKRYLPDH
jgi:undecaprenyl-diphosphatase